MLEKALVEQIMAQQGQQEMKRDCVPTTSPSDQQVVDAIKAWSEGKQLKTNNSADNLFFSEMDLAN